MSNRVVITGASSGIGEAVAYELARRGHDLGLTARRLEKLQEIRANLRKEHPAIRVEIRQLDVTDDEAVAGVIDDLARALGGIDVVFANAGIGYFGNIGEGGFQGHRRVIETNLLGAMATVDAAVACFLKQGYGHIVGVCSVSAFIGLPELSSYCASKAGFASYLETLRTELHGKNIRVTVLYPGFIDTAINHTMKHRPFMITVERGARLIVDYMEKKRKSAIFPVFPWKFIARLLRFVPNGIMSRF